MEVRVRGESSRGVGRPWVGVTDGSGRRLSEWTRREEPVESATSEGGEAIGWDSNNNDGQEVHGKERPWNRDL